MDQSMISYLASCGSRQRINNKPIRMGCKVWVLTESNSNHIKVKTIENRLPTQLNYD